MIFIDKASSHSSNYTITNKTPKNAKVFFNAPYSPALNIIELIFCDIKLHIRKKDR